MKFMKLGTRPDTFTSIDDSTRSVLSDIPTDITIQVNTTKFLLHKFPLLSKCSHLKKNKQLRIHSTTVNLPDFPGGATAFELCAKFCYNMAITLSAHNIVAAIAAADYLSMTDEEEQGNLLGKLESFFISCLLRRWKDTLTVLHTTTHLSTYSERLCIVSRCIDALVAMIVTYPERDTGVPWWLEDVLELRVREFTSIVGKMRGRVRGELVGHAVERYVRRWPTDVEVLEGVVRVLPEEKGAVGCGFLMGMLKVEGFDGEGRGVVVRRVVEQLEGAAVAELGDDVEIVMEVVGEFMKKEVNDGGEEKVVKVGRLVDEWLKERAVEMSVEKVVEVACMVPHWARENHDPLYTVVDLYLKAHPDLNKVERKRLCRILDCKKLSVEACMHAAQNERLPLRMVVQVLFFEQARAAASGTRMAELPANIKALLAGVVPSHKCNPNSLGQAKCSLENGRLDDEWSASSMKCHKPSLATLRMKLAEDEHEMDEEDVHGVLRKNGLMRSTSTRFKAICAIQEKPKRMLSRLWSINRSMSERH